MSFCVCWGRRGEGGIALQLSFPEMLEGTSRVFIPPIRPGDGLGFQAVSLSCHQTNEALSPGEERERERELPAIHDP